MSVRAFLGLGGNLGQPEHTIRQALAELSKHPNLVISSVSSFYRTEPVGMAAVEGESIPWFVNAVAQVETTLSARELLGLCLAVEQHFGRDRSFQPNRHGALSRTLDVDLLLYGKQLISEPDLVVPHPRLHERLFTLMPLNELAPDLVHPLLQQPVGVLLQALPHQAGISLLQPA